MIKNQRFTILSGFPVVGELLNTVIGAFKFDKYQMTKFCLLSGLIFFAYRENSPIVDNELKSFIEALISLFVNAYGFF